MQDQSNVIQRIIQLTHEIQKTYGFGKSYTISSAPVRGYAPEEWERKERERQRWLETAREWSRIRNPLIAELQTLAELHRDEWPELNAAVQRISGVSTGGQEAEWGQIRRIAVAMARRCEGDKAARRNEHAVDGNSLPASKGQHDPTNADTTGESGRVVEPSVALSLKPSHRRAKSLFEWAMENLYGAEDMTYAQLFDALVNAPRCWGEGLPNNAATFARYCRAAGIHRNTLRSHKGATRSIRRSSDL